MKTRPAFPRWLLALLLVVPLIAIPGCGSPEPKPDTVGGADEAIVSVSEWRNPNSLRSIVKDFARLEWRSYEVEQGTEGQTLRVVYIHEGREMVGGEETDKITLAFSDQDKDWTIWLDAGGRPKQTASGNEVIPGQVGVNMGQGMLTMAGAPFLMNQSVSVLDVLRGRREGWSYTELSRSTERFGVLTAEVIRLQLTARPPAVAKGEELNAIWGIADFGDFQMLVEWRILHDEAGENARVLYMIEIVEVR